MFTPLEEPSLPAAVVLEITSGHRGILGVRLRAVTKFAFSYYAKLSSVSWNQHFLNSNTKVFDALICSSLSV